MSTFKNAFSDDHLHEVIGLNRVKTHTGPDREFGQISASRGNLSSSENYARHKELMGMVKKAGYGYAKGHGAYPEAGGNGMQRERSLMVFPGKEKKDGLHDFLMKAGAHFQQDSVIHKPTGTDEPNLHVTTEHPDGEGGVNKVGSNFPIGKFHANMTGMFGHSELRTGKDKAPAKGKTAASKKTFVFGDKADLKPA